MGSDYLRALDHQQAQPRGRVLDMLIAPHAFQIEGDPVFTPNYEVAEVVWVPVEYLLDTDNRQEMTWNYKGIDIPMPCYRFGDRVIWGLSLMMLDELMDLVEGGKNPLRPRWRR